MIRIRREGKETEVRGEQVVGRCPMRSGIRLLGYILMMMGLLESLANLRGTGRIMKVEQWEGSEEEAGSLALIHLERKSEVSQVEMICFWREAIAGVQQRVGGGLEVEQGMVEKEAGDRALTGPLHL